MNIKKVALGLIFVAAAAGTFNCGSSACDDFKTEYTDCCNKITDQTAKDACNAALDQVDFDNATDDQCQQLSDAFTCPM